MAVSVRSGTFEQEKTDMVLALGKYIESLLERSRPMTKEQAA
jgi:hypothetical protein